VYNKDFEKWLNYSLKDPTLAGEIKKIAAAKRKGETLRKAILTASKKRYTTLCGQVEESLRLT
jgi:hypothetical protein